MPLCDARNDQKANGSCGEASEPREAAAGSVRNSDNLVTFSQA